MFLTKASGVTAVTSTWLTVNDLVTGEVSEPVKKKLRMVNMAMEEEREEQVGKEEEEEEGREQGENADMYQHIREAKKKFDAQALDAATKVSC